MNTNNNKSTWLICGLVGISILILHRICIDQFNQHILPLLSVVKNDSWVIQILMLLFVFFSYRWMSLKHNTFSQGIEMFPKRLIWIGLFGGLYLFFRIRYFNDYVCYGLEKLKLCYVDICLLAVGLIEIGFLLSRCYYRRNKENHLETIVKSFFAENPTNNDGLLRRDYAECLVEKIVSSFNDNVAKDSSFTILLNEKYGIEEEDFVSAEIEIVPAGPSRDFGLDRSMVAGYGHDDRVCAYTSLKAILDIENPTYTSCCILVDKEEIGSVGATGAQSLFFENTIGELLELQGEYSSLKVRRALKNSKMLSSDVSAGFDPMFPQVNEAKNSAYLGQGVCFNKYTGSRGKSGSNDANPEYMAEIRRIMDEDNVYYQTAELGRVDQGGGGTIAYILGNYDMNVIDAGIPVLSMHAPMEIVSKVDVYEAYVAYKTFLLKA